MYVEVRGSAGIHAPRTTATNARDNNRALTLESLGGCRALWTGSRPMPRHRNAALVRSRIIGLSEKAGALHVALIPREWRTLGRAGDAGAKRRQLAHRERESRPRYKRAERRVSGAGPFRGSDALADDPGRGEAHPHVQGVSRRARRRGGVSKNCADPRGGVVSGVKRTRPNGGVARRITEVEQFKLSEHAWSLDSHAAPSHLVRARCVLRCPLLA